MGVDNVAERLDKMPLAAIFGERQLFGLLFFDVARCDRLPSRPLSTDYPTDDGASCGVNLPERKPGDVGEQQILDGVLHKLSLLFGAAGFSALSRERERKSPGLPDDSVQGGASGATAAV